MSVVPGDVMMDPVGDVTEIELPVKVPVPASVRDCPFDWSVKAPVVATVEEFVNEAVVKVAVLA